jgi:hypothetical protein
MKFLCCEVYTNYLVRINNPSKIATSNLKWAVVFGYVIESETKIPNIVYKNMWFLPQKHQASFALTKFGEVFSWGKNSSRWLGHGGDTPEDPKQIDSLANYFVQAMKSSIPIEASNNMFFTVALTKDGKVFTWVCSNFSLSFLMKI